jgi:hypothetical protein
LRTNKSAKSDANRRRVINCLPLNNSHLHGNLKKYVKKLPTDVCSLPQVEGPCSGSLPQYYYDMETDSCQLFNYGGCQGNRNRFDSIVQCEQRCRKSAPSEDEQLKAYYEEVRRRQEEEEEERRRQEQPAESEEEQRRQYEEDLRRRQEEERQEISPAEEEEERRRQYEERLREDMRRREEYERAQEEDRAAGEGQREEMTTVMYPTSDICELPVEVGPCRASVPSYYFDPGTGRCTSFLFGGCQGNANRFDSEEACERMCGAFRGQGELFFSLFFAQVLFLRSCSFCAVVVFCAGRVLLLCCAVTEKTLSLCAR